MIPSLHGIQAPKFVSGATTVLLDNVTVLQDEPDFKEIIHESIINRHREFIDIPDHWVFIVRYNLFKFADKKNKYDQLMSFEHQEVELWKRRDGNSNGNFVIDDIIPQYVRTGDFPDYLIIKFVSKEPIEVVNIIALPATEITRSSFIANWYLWIGAEGYKLDISKSPDFSTYVLEDEDVGSSLSYLMEGLNSGTAYYYRVRYYRNSIDSQNSNRIDLVTEIASDFWFQDQLSESPSHIFTWKDEITVLGKLMETEDQAGNRTLSSFTGHACLYSPLGWSGLPPMISYDIEFTPSHTIVALVNSKLFHSGVGFPNWNSPDTDSFHRLTIGGSYMEFGFSSGGLLAVKSKFGTNFENLYSSKNIFGNETWYIVARTFNYTTKIMTLYILGEKVQDTYPDALLTSATTWGLIPQDFGGTLGESKIWNRSLNDSEINIEGAYFANRYGLTWIDI